MPYETIEVRKVTPAIGAEISGVDLAGPLSNRQVSELHDALMAHQVIFFRDQQMSVDQHKAFGRLFGELLIHPAARAEVEGHPEIRVVHADAKTEVATGEVWHSDMSCEPEPPMGSILYLHQTPPVGGDTAFANMYLAYETLSEPIKRLVEGLSAFHTSAHVYSRGAYERSDKKFPEAVHPIVRRHPVTGRKCLFINRGFTKRIEGLKKHESDALLEMLVRHAETPEFQCRFRWDRHSVAFWDNRCAMHRATFDYHPHVRHGHRVTIRGDRPV
jgi:taurine dioxygenase